MTTVETLRDSQIGRTTGRYEIVHLIGIGAMSRVYQARRITDGTSCAVKVMTREAAESPNLRERFRREALAMSSVVHAHVVGLVELIEDGDRVSLVMELVRGQTLSAFLHRAERFDPKRAAGLIQQIAAGLSAIHAAGFVHRDLKPSNVMIATNEDGSESAKILDLGMVGYAPGTLGKKITEPGFTVGTASYMAPEQAYDASVGPAADLYSLGVIAHELIYGRAPGMPSRPPSGPRRQMTDPRGIGSFAGTALDRIIARLVEPIPSLRPSSAELVTWEIDRILASLPGATPRPEVHDESEAQTEDLPDAATVPDRPVSTKP